METGWVVMFHLLGSFTFQTGKLALVNKIVLIIFFHTSLDLVCVCFIKRCGTKEKNMSIYFIIFPVYSTCLHFSPYKDV